MEDQPREATASCRDSRARGGSIISRERGGERNTTGGDGTDPLWNKSYHPT